MVRPLAAHNRAVAGRIERGERKRCIATFDFLQCDDIGPRFGQPALKICKPLDYAVYVEGCDPHRARRFVKPARFPLLEEDAVNRLTGGVSGTPL